MFNNRWMLRGLASGLLRCLVNHMVGRTRLARLSQSTPTDDMDGSRPSSFRTISRYIFGRPAPTQIRIGWAAAGRPSRPFTR